jgi:hypothetical protein
MTGLAYWIARDFPLSEWFIARMGRHEQQHLRLQALTGGLDQRPMFRVIKRVREPHDDRPEACPHGWGRGAPADPGTSAEFATLL